MDRVGFVGVGIMGHGMAHNILAKGWPLTVLAHRRREAVEDLLAKGAAEATGLADLAQRSDVVVLCLTASPQVEEVVAGLLPGLRPQSVIVDTTTADPVSTERLGAMLREREAGLVDAPLGRTPKDAWDGTLDSIVGALDADFARVEPVLRAYSARILRVGGPGAGHRMKLVNNFLSIGYGALYAEALTLAEKVGLDVATFDRVIRDGRMDCGFYRSWMGYALDGDRDAHRFTLTNAHKDMGYVDSMAAAARVAVPMAAAAKMSYRAALAQGGDGPEDYLPHLIDFVRRMNGAGRPR
jgi:3-hydroxyisobutyrate dehydrogenase-like beta-hydroxyacid dehydrogenase